MARQLAPDDRKRIQTGLDRRESFKQIAAATGKHCSSITREVRSHLVIERTGACGRHFNDCAHRFGCSVEDLCDNELCRGGRCSNCHMLLCSRMREDYEQQTCSKLELPPYVCNGCPDRRKCTLEKPVYKPK